MIIVCSRCSGVNIKELKEALGDNVKSGCIGECGEHSGKSFGYIDGELVIKKSSQDFIDAAKKAINY